MLHLNCAMTDLSVHLRFNITYFVQRLFNIVNNTLVCFQKFLKPLFDIMSLTSDDQLFVHIS